MKNLIQTKKTRMKERFLDETIVDLQAVENGEFHAYDEYLIELVKESSGKKYCAKVYKLVAKGTPDKDPNTALEESMSFVKLRRQSRTPSNPLFSRYERI